MTDEIQQSAPSTFKRHDRVVVTEPHIAGWAMGQPGQPGGFPCLPGMIFTYWRPNITIRGADHATLIAPGGSKLYNVPQRILRLATDEEVAAFNANAPKDPSAPSEDPTPTHERSNESVGQDYVRTMLDRTGRAAAELAERVAHEPRDWPDIQPRVQHRDGGWHITSSQTAPVATAFFKPGGKFYTDEQIDVPPSPFLDFVAAWEAHPRVQHFHRQGFHAVARFDVHPDGFPVMFVGAATPEEVARAVEAADMEGSASTLRQAMRARRAEDGLKVAAEQLTENAGQMTAAAELLERALVTIVASAASDDDAHRLARDIRRLLYGAPSNPRA